MIAFPCNKFSFDFDFDFINELIMGRLRSCMWQEHGIYTSTRTNGFWPITGQLTLVHLEIKGDKPAQNCFLRSNTFAVKEKVSRASCEVTRTTLDDSKPRI